MYCECGTTPDGHGGPLDELWLVNHNVSSAPLEASSEGGGDGVSLLFLLSVGKSMLLFVSKRCLTLLVWGAGKSWGSQPPRRSPSRRLGPGRRWCWCRCHRHGCHLPDLAMLKPCWSSAAARIAGKADGCVTREYCLALQGLVWDSTLLTSPGPTSWNFQAKG